MINLIKIKNVTPSSQGRTEQAQYQHLLDKYDQVMDILERSERNKQVTNYVVFKTKDGVAGFEIHITNKDVRSDDTKALVESTGFYPCGLTKLLDIANYINYWQYNQCFEMLKAYLDVTDDSINLDSALAARKSLASSK